MAKVILPRSNVVRGYNQSRPAAPPQPIRMDAPPAAGLQHCERVLLLEDEAQTNMILREYLECLGYQVVAVANGVDGLKEVMKSDFELVICDMMMPKLPGDMFYLAVQKTRPHLCNRFLFITGHQENPKVDAFIARTHSAILVKPFRLQQLEATLEGILSRFPKKVRPVDSATPQAAPSILEPAITEIPPPTAYEAAPAGAMIAPERTPSMVSKALKMVGFMRKPEPVKPAARITRRIAADTASPAGEKPPARITRRVPDQPARITRRIAHLASAPVVNPHATPPATPVPTIRVTRKIPAPAPAPTSDVGRGAALPRTTRRITPPAKEPADPKVTPKVPKSGSIIRIEHSKTGASATATEGVLTRKIPATAPRKVPTPVPAPKTTQKIPKITVRIAKTPKAAPEGSLAPRVTARIKAPALLPVEKAAARVVTRRVTTAKKA